MLPSKHMNTDELKKLDEDLAKRQAEIERELGAVAVENPAVKGDFEPKVPNYDDDGHDDDDYVHEVADLATNIALEKQLEKELEDIKKTRDKIKNGTYGHCESCTQPISSDRLKALPVASLCIACAKLR